MNPLQAVRFYNPAMRSWLVVLLLVLMPLQFSWAAMGAFCQHKCGSDASHAGHHAHEHRSQSDSDGATSQTAASVADADCGTCHAGCSIAAPDAQAGVGATTSASWALGRSVQPRSAPFDVPERPQWHALS
jgi:hypothetical protein